MTTQEIIAGLRQQEKTHRQNARYFGDEFYQSDNTFTWFPYLANLMKEAADFIEITVRQENDRLHPNEPGINR